MTRLSSLARCVVVAACGVMLAPPPAMAESDDGRIAPGLAGAFLSGRAAVSDDSFAVMADSYDRALAADPGNQMFRELAMQGHVMTGNIDRAVALAAESAAEGDSSQVAAVILQADEFMRGAYDAVLGALEDGRRSGPLTDAMGAAWAELGRGSMSDALAAFEIAIEERPEMAPFALYQKAMALALVGDLERAVEILSGDPHGPVTMSRRGVLGQMALLSQLDRFDEALEIGARTFGSAPEDEAAETLAALEAGEAVPFTTVTSARDGMAELYFTLGSALLGDDNDWLPLIYVRLAVALRPDHGDAILLTGQLLERAGQYALAEAAFAQMPEEHALYLGAQLGSANALYASGQTDEAIDQLMALSAERPESAQVFSTLGDMLRREERFDEAADAYTAAIDLIDEIEERHWVLLYTRAIALERMGEWERAEPEFRRVLEFVPDEPQVLNYLGYSLVEQRSNLDEAPEMIERAVEGDPESGYIVDSLGWALYRLGRYDEALPVMERAVELMPRDPILNDHLGDVYYAVGREREARFQWRRALSFGPHADLDMDLVRRKLEIGKDAAVEEFDADE